MWALEPGCSGSRVSVLPFNKLCVLRQVTSLICKTVTVLPSKSYKLNQLVHTVLTLLPQHSSSIKVISGKWCWNNNGFILKTGLKPELPPRPTPVGTEQLPLLVHTWTTQASHFLIRAHLRGTDQTYPPWSLHPRITNILTIFIYLNCWQHLCVIHIVIRSPHPTFP